MDRKVFFDTLKPIFGGRFQQSQVDGLNILLDEMPPGWGVTWAAYSLATACGETNYTMQPVEENLTYTTTARLKKVFPSKFKTSKQAAPYVRNPIALANLVYGKRLGNKAPGDGWRYRGGGYCQLTGLDNYHKAGALVGIDLVAHPERAREPKVAARILYQGMLTGLFTSKKLADYLAKKTDYYNARRIINGTFEAEKFVGLALVFEKALRSAGYGKEPFIIEYPTDVKVEEFKVSPLPDVEILPPPEPPVSWWRRLFWS